MSEIRAVPFNTSCTGGIAAAIAAAIDATCVQRSSVYRADLAKVDALRAATLAPALDPDAVHTVTEYIAVVLALQAIFTDELSFQWRNGLTGARLTASSLDLELGNCLYNLGALYASLARQQTDPIAACKQFQLAAGCLNHVATNTSLQNATTAPAQALATASLAAAQEMSWLKATRAQHSSSVLARLAWQTALYYGASADQCASLRDASLGDASLGDAALDNASLDNASLDDASLDNAEQHLRCKAAYFQAVALYRQAQHLAAAGGPQHGAAVRAAIAGRDRLHHCRLPNTLPLKHALDDLLRDTTRDNDFLHLQPVPAEPAPPPPVSLVKPVPVTLPPPAAVFADLLPLALYDTVRAYETRQHEYLQSELLAPLAALRDALQTDPPTAESLPRCDSSLKHFAHQNKLLRHQLHTAPPTTAAQTLSHYLDTGALTDTETADLCRRLDRSLLALPPPAQLRTLDALATRARNATQTAPLLDLVLAAHRATGATACESHFLHHLATAYEPHRALLRRYTTAHRDLRALLANVHAGHTFYADLLRAVQAHAQTPPPAPPADPPRSPSP